MEQNRRIVEDAFERWRKGQGSILDLMGNDGVVVIPGTAPHCGTKGKHEFVTQVAMPFMSRFSRPPVPLPSRIMAEGDDVIVVADAHGTTVNDEAYSNSYVFVLTFRDGRLMRATEYLDMAAFNAVWDSVPTETKTANTMKESR